MPSIVDETFQLGKLGSELFPAWVESEFKDFEDYLDHHGLPRKLAMMAFTYYEVPSVEIWRQLGYTAVAIAARKQREERLDALLNGGANPLDVLTID